MEERDELYSELLLDLYRHPLNKKRPADFDLSFAEFNPLCGDRVKLFLKFNDEGLLSDIGFEGEGCAISQAATSLVTEHVKGKTKEYIRELSPSALLDLMGLKNINPTRLRCALLGLQAIKKSFSTT